MEKIRRRTNLSQLLVTVAWTKSEEASNTLGTPVGHGLLFGVRTVPPVIIAVAARVVLCTTFLRAHAFQARELDDFLELFNRRGPMVLIATAPCGTCFVARGAFSLPAPT
jgi:hypothetical protein